MRNKPFTLDSNVFKTQTFIDWVMSDEGPKGNHVFPLITYIEVLVWYEMRRLTRKDLDKDLKDMSTEIIEFSLKYVDDLMSNIRSAPSHLFQHHARDFIIGTICKEN